MTINPHHIGTLRGMRSPLYPFENSIYKAIDRAAAASRYASFARIPSAYESPIEKALGKWERDFSVIQASVRALASQSPGVYTPQFSAEAVRAVVGNRLRIPPANDTMAPPEPELELDILVVEAEPAASAAEVAASVPLVTRAQAALDKVEPTRKALMQLVGWKAVFGGIGAIGWYVYDLARRMLHH